MSDYSCGASRLPDEPRGYAMWHEWAEQKGKTHDQKLCPKCKRWHIWTPKKKGERVEKEDNS